MQQKDIRISANLPVKAINAGLFVSRGLGRHPDRVIDSYEIIFVRTGKLYIFEGNKDYCVEEGHVLILHPGIRHGGLETYSKDLSFYYLHFNIDWDWNKPGNFEMDLPKSVSISRLEIVKELFHRFLSEQEKSSRNINRLNLLTMQILIEINDSYSIDKAGVISNSLCEMADKFIRTAFHHKLNTAVIADALNCNADYLGRIYHRAYGITLTEAIQNCRINHACKLLLDSTKNIDEIARESGYDDPGYFRRVFKKHKGINPSKFKSLYSLFHLITE